MKHAGDRCPGQNVVHRPIRGHEHRRIVGESVRCVECSCGWVGAPEVLAWHIAEQTELARDGLRALR